MKKTLFLFFLGFAISSQIWANDSTYTSYRELRHSPDFYTDLIKSFQHKGLASNDTGIAFLDSAIAHYKNSPCELSSALTAKGRLFYNNNQYDSASQYFLKGALKNRANCSAFNTYYLYNSWAILQEKIDAFYMSDSLYNIALAAAKKLKNKTYELNVVNNKANNLSNNDQYPEAIRLLKNSLKIADEEHILTHQLYSRQNLGSYYIDIGKYDSAMVFYAQLKELMVEEDWPFLAMDMYNNMATCYEEFGDLAAADSLYKKAITLAKENNRYHALLIYLSNYSFLKNRLKEFEESRSLLLEYVHVKDSLFGAERYESIKLLEKQYEIAKQREELLAQKLEIEQNTKNRNTLLFASMGLLAALIGAFSRLRYIRKSKLVLEAEKKRSDDLLLNILPAQVAEELKQTGMSDAKQFDDASVIFTDFVEFTNISERLSAKELVNELNECFKAFDEIVTQLNLEKIKTIGDAYMAASGLQAPKKAGAKEAVLAGIQMQEFMANRQAKLAKRGKSTFKMRVGVHTGPVVAGIVGVKKFQYDIWGDTVNTASRMESTGLVGQVNISHGTYLLIKNDKDFLFESRGAIDVKGKGKIEMWTVSFVS